MGNRAHRILALAVLSGFLPAWTAGAGGPSALAAEAGVGLANPGALQIADVRALGTHWVRMFATWPDLEPARGVFAPNWLASYEHVFSELPVGTKVIIDVVDSPRWETSSSDEHVPPANPNDYGAFLGALAHRWAGRVSAYEIWNEEDAPGWWAGAPDPAAYARLLEATYPVLKAAEPNASLVLGGLAGNDYQFLEGVYQAGGKGSFDAVGVHTDTACNVLSPYEFLRGPDSRMIPDSFLAYREVHETMLANGDDKPIWMTETSWRTTTATCSEGLFAGHKPEGVTLAQQAKFLSQAYHCLAQDPYVKVALWYPLKDEQAIASGLVRPGGSPKPSFAAMRSYAKQGDRLKEPCGVLTGPRIRVFAPANGVTYSGPLRIHVSARASDGVFRITLKLDGKLIRNYDDPAYPVTLSGLLEWRGATRVPYGRHILTFVAYDRERNVAQRSITIYHRAAHHRPAGKRIAGPAEKRRPRREPAVDLPCGGILKPWPNLSSAVTRCPAASSACASAPTAIPSPRPNTPGWHTWPWLPSRSSS